MPSWNVVTNNQTVGLTVTSPSTVSISIANPSPIRVVTALEQGPAGTAGAITGEIPTGTVNGINTHFVLTNIYLNILDVQLNGLGGEAWSVVDSHTIALTDPPVAGDHIKVIYAH